MGARHALEWEQGEGPDDRYSLLARTCLTKGDFMTHHTIYGVQTLASRRHFPDPISLTYHQFIMAAYKLSVRMRNMSLLMLMTPVKLMRVAQAFLLGHYSASPCDL
jgi:hypothetical protein